MIWRLFRDETNLGDFARQGTRSTIRNGAGTASWTVSMDAAVDPLVEELWQDGAARTWWDDRLELRVWDPDAEGYVWVGPVVAVDADWVGGFLTVNAQTREAHVLALINGMREPTNILTQGIFDSSLTDWDDQGSATASAENTGAVYWPGSYAMEVNGEPGEVATWLHVDSFANPNVIHFAVAANPLSSSWPDWGAQNGQLVGEVTHYWSADLGTPHGTYSFTIPSAVSGWHRSTVVVPRTSGRANSYRIRIFTSIDGDPVRVGELRAATMPALGAYEGDDISLWPAAVMSYAAGRLNDWGGATWDYDVDPVGEDWFSNKREPGIDMAGVGSMLRDVEAFGEWWVDGWTLRWAPERGVVLDYVASLDNASGVRSSHDGSTAANRCLAYSNVLRGPLRDEGRAEDDTGGAVLDSVLESPPGTDPRDLQRLAVDHVATSGPARSLTLTPNDLDVDFAVGDSFDFTLTRGACSEVGVARVESVSVDDRTGARSIDVEVVSGGS